MKRRRIKLKIDVTKCELLPINYFGDHYKGYMGCMWCKIRNKCLQFNPTKGSSLIWKERMKWKKIKQKLVK